MTKSRTCVTHTAIVVCRLRKSKGLGRIEEAEPIDAKKGNAAACHVPSTLAPNWTSASVPEVTVAPVRSSHTPLYTPFLFYLFFIALSPTPFYFTYLIRFIASYRPPRVELTFCIALRGGWSHQLHLNPRRSVFSDGHCYSVHS